MDMINEKKKQYNDLLREMEFFHKNKEYEQMSEIYTEMDRIECDDELPENNESKSLEYRTFFAPLLEDNSIKLPKEIIKELDISSSALLSVTALKYPDIILINVYAEKMLLYDISGNEDIFGNKLFGKYKVKIENGRIQIKDYIIKAMNVNPYDTMQIDFLNGMMCVRAYDMPLSY